MMSKRPAFWILLTLFCGLGLYFAVSNFPRAFPIVSLDLRMDRGAALRSARSLARQNDWGPPGEFRQAASFGVDDTVQTFVELAGGGKDSLRRMLDRGLYAAYTWSVRDFKQGEAHETTVRFTPAGTPYGFTEKLREAAPGASLAESDARRIAEDRAAGLWNVDLTAYVPVETSKEVKPGGRTDHTFVYERPLERLGEGRYRLRLVVGGDRLTELTHFVKVPETFARRYEEMRSTNDTIAFGALVVAIVLYFLGGGGFGLFTLLRRRWVLWRQPLALGAVVALIQALDVLNSWPLAWMNYNTALPGSTFMLQRVGAVFGTFMLSTFYLTLTFMAAESLTRRAFPHHPQMWRLWSRDAAGTLQLLGRTLGGYLYTGIEFAYIVGFYLIASRLFGWWTPSDSLVQPNILATYMPWLSAVAPSLHAGLWEESMFRAIPIAGAALIGDRFGKRGVWIGMALVLQAVVFGGGHANYASEPAYSRLVELILPAFAWGIVYLCFGLLPTIITHYVFDLSLFAIPLFTSTSSGARVDQALVVLCGLIPLGIVLVARVRSKAWSTLGEAQLNRAWAPPPVVEAESAPVATAEPRRARVSAARVRISIALGIVALGAWALVGWKSDAPRFAIGRVEARKRALEAVAARGFVPPSGWNTVPTVETPPELQSRFVWQTSGPDVYRSLVDRYVQTPHWKARTATFAGDVVERAEEWEVELTSGGSVARVRHRLPQRRPGPVLEEAPARVIAHQALRDRLGADPLVLSEMSAVSSQLPARRDWTFTFADTAARALKQGQLRLAIEIAGDQVSDARRYVFVPEDWERKFRSEEGLLGILGTARGVLLALVVVAGVVFAIVFWSRRNFPARVAGVIFACLALIYMVQLAITWPVLEGRFSTAQPLELQRITTLVGGGLGRLLLAGAAALVVGLAHGRSRSSKAGAGAPILLGVATGLIFAGFVRMLSLLSQSRVPSWPDYGGAQTLLPVLREAIAPIPSLFLRSAVVLLAFGTVERLTLGWTRSRFVHGTLLFIFGALIAQLGAWATPGQWALQALISGTLILAAYVLVFRYDLTLVPVAIGTLGALGALRTARLAAYPGAALGGLIGFAVVVAVTALWVRTLRAEGTRAASQGPA